MYEDITCSYDLDKYFCSSEKYKYGYFLRAKKCYEVIDNFPCITRNKVMFGVSEITYAIDLNVCHEFQIEWNNMISQIKEV